jgi:tetratricopeptide (TPR) repeat protein
MEKCTIETDVRLSKSALWRLQQAAYCQFGPQAWSEKGVPFYLTSNPYTARLYALIASAWLRDCANKGSATPLDCTEPVYILDLGAGTGRFGYLFLKQLLELLSTKPLQSIQICYVMTDIAENNLTFLEEHPYLQAYIKEGLLDFTYYHHATANAPLELRKSKQILSPETIVNPLMLIGNYFFDTIPQDLFRVRHGKLEEGHVTIQIPKDNTIESVNMDDPLLIQHLECSFDYVPLETSSNYYPGFPAANSVLEFYNQCFDNIPFLFPIGAFQSLQYFQYLSKGRLFLLAGDQGVSSEEQVKKWGEPKIALHGSFSISVSYHAIAHYFRIGGGFALLTTQPDPLFTIITAGLGSPLEKYPETKLAFRIYMEHFEPKDYWNIVHYSEQEWRTPSIEYLLLLLKLGNWDPMNLNSFFQVIRSLLPTATPENKEQLAIAIGKVWENFYPVSPSEGDFVLNLGVLYFDMQMYQESLEFFKKAIDLCGERIDLLKNIAACYRALHDPDSAKYFLEKALEIKGFG